MPNVSLRKATRFSNTAITVEKLANVINRKKSVPQIRPPVIFTKTFGMSRTKASIINGIIMFFACLPCIFGFNIWSDFNILGKGVLDLEDFVVSNLLLPIGAMVYLLFCTTKFGWGFDNYFEECNTGKGLKLSRVLKPYLKYALPVLIVIVFVQGFIG